MRTSARLAMSALVALLLACAPLRKGPGDEGKLRRLVVLHFQNKLQGADKKALGDRTYFSERVRREVIGRMLPGVTLMTAQQMQDLAAANRVAVESCDDTQCSQVGQVLGADLVIDGTITKVGPFFILVIRLVETKAPGRQLASKEARGRDVAQLLDETGPAVRGLLEPLEPGPQ